MKRIKMLASRAAVASTLVAALGCGDIPDPTCRGMAASCEERKGWFPLCSEPEVTQAVDDADGLFCVNDATSSSGRSYIGPALDEAPGCSGGTVTPCADGAAPICVYLAGCLPNNL